MVLRKLEEIERDISGLSNKMDSALTSRDVAIRKLEIDMAVIKTKVIVFGALAGFFGTGLLQLAIRLFGSQG